jgi:hypothetical protein
MATHGRLVATATATAKHGRSPATRSSPIKCSSPWWPPSRRWVHPRSSPLFFVSC